MKPLLLTIAIFSLNLVAAAQSNCCPGKWGNITINYPGSLKLVPFKCGETIKAKCNVPYTIRTPFTCRNQKLCTSRVLYSLSPSVGATLTKGASACIFKGTANGSYKLTIYGYCGKSKCDSCTFQIRVTGCTK